MPLGPSKCVARPERFSVQPGGTSIEKPAAVPVSDGLTVSVVQPDGRAVDGALSAFTEPNGVLGLGFTVFSVVPDAVAPGWWLSASAAPMPAAAAITTAPAISAILRPRRERCGRPLVPGAYSWARSGYGCDGPAYCWFGPGGWAFAPYGAFEPHCALDPPCALGPHGGLAPQWSPDPARHWGLESLYCVSSCDGDGDGWGGVGGAVRAGAAAENDGLGFGGARSCSTGSIDVAAEGASGADGPETSVG